MILLEFVELRVGPCEFACEPLFEITQPGDAGLARVGLPAAAQEAARRFSNSSSRWPQVR